MISTNRKLKGSNRNLKKESLLKLLKKLPRLLFLRCLWNLLRPKIWIRPLQTKVRQGCQVSRRRATKKTSPPQHHLKGKTPNRRTNLNPRNHHQSPRHPHQLPLRNQGPPKSHWAIANLCSLPLHSQRSLKTNSSHPRQLLTLRSHISRPISVWQGVRSCSRSSSRRKRRRRRARRRFRKIWMSKKDNRWRGALMRIAWRH